MIIISGIVVGKYLNNSLFLFPFSPYFCLLLLFSEFGQRKQGAFQVAGDPRTNMIDALSQYSTEEILVELEERGKIENVLENFALVEIFQELRRRGFVGNVVQPSENTGYELLENGVTQYEWLK